MLIGSTEPTCDSAGTISALSVAPLAPLAVAAAVAAAFELAGVGGCLESGTCSTQAVLLPLLVCSACFDPCVETGRSGAPTAKDSLCA